MQQKILAMITIFFALSVGKAFAETCYDPYYGYYDCNPSYSYYNQPTFMEGAFFGFVLGGIASQMMNEGNDWNDHRDRHWRRHGYPNQNYQPYNGYQSNPAYQPGNRYQNRGGYRY